jgi:hypothetical protein
MAMKTRIAVTVFLFALFAGFALVGTIGATNPNGTADPVFGLGWTDLGYSLSPD